MKKLLILYFALIAVATADARVPDHPDYTDENGYQYKHFRDKISGHLIQGREQEVLFWGVDDRYGELKDKWAAVKKFTVPVKMVVKNKTGKTITLPVTAVDGHAFNNLPNLEEIVLPEGITYVNPFALSDTKAKRINIPASWKENIYNFGGYKSQWEYISVAKNHPTRCSINGLIYNKNKTILYAFPRCRKGEVILPATLKEIDDDVFEDAEYVTKITLPEGVVKVGKNAFYQCAAETIILPSTLKTIGINALNYCKKLKSLRCMAKIPPTVLMRENEKDYMELWGIKLETLIVYIPKGSLKQYKKATWWRKVKNYVEQ